MSPYRKASTRAPVPSPFWRQLLGRAAATLWVAAKREWVWAPLVLLLGLGAALWLFSVGIAHIEERSERSERAREAAPCREQLTEHGCPHAKHRLVIEGKHVVCRCPEAEAPAASGRP